VWPTSGRAQHNGVVNEILENDNSGLVVLITGGARRIGAAIARSLHDDGWRVIIHYRHSTEPAQALTDDLNRKRADSAACCAADLHSVTAIDALAAGAHARWKRLDALVNNASSYFSTPLAELDEAQFDELFATNLKAPLFLTRACLPLFGTDAAVVNILDALARHAQPGFAVYNSAKAALWAVTETLAVEMAPKVRVNAVAPGHILWAESAELDAQQQQDKLDRVPLRRLGTPEEIAASVRFLLSPQASFLNGVILPVDGGRRLR